MGFRLLVRYHALALVCACAVALGAPATVPASAAAPRASHSYGIYVLGELARASGFESEVRIGRAPVAFAQAMIIDERSAILYNPASLGALERETGNPWSAVSVIAHELGHHYFGHTERGIGGIAAEASHHCELDADYFSGYTLSRLGASLEDAQAAQRWLNHEETPLHPGSDCRLRAIEAGYQRGRAGLALPAALAWKEDGALVGGVVEHGMPTALAVAEPLQVETGKW